MKYIHSLTALLLIMVSFIDLKEEPVENKSAKSYEKSLANYDDFKNLVNQVEDYREQRLIDYNTFSKMSQQENVVILDTRSAYHFNRKHIKGAIHLNFSEFTQDNLIDLIPDPNTTILIYCNNNFKDDQIDFTSKVAAVPVLKINNQQLDNKKITLALNIPTFINLYGYGYKNVYELDELVSALDSRIELEGTEVY